ncbi:hypothetical protein WR25_17147 [Diploscapter pachys]|uniref:Uncharacterized protein n=1 Tax=Diploscapter pachys TaxID=2018661 RepID=A0A2A2JGU8_9BILA|nr:hypothetical protein WR25_17147 [Diploscapter pachys]
MTGRLTEEGLFATAASANDTLTHYERSELTVKTSQTGSNWPIERNEEGKEGDGRADREKAMGMQREIEVTLNDCGDREWALLYKKMAGGKGEGEERNGHQLLLNAVQKQDTRIVDRRKGEEGRKKWPEGMFLPEEGGGTEAVRPKLK